MDIPSLETERLILRAIDPDRDFEASEEIDYCPMVTPDGKYFFFTQGNDLMWVDAAIIETYRD